MGEIKLTQKQWFFNVPTFGKVKIFTTDGKYLIAYKQLYDSSDGFINMYIESKNYIIEVYGWLHKRAELDIEYYSSYEECIEVIKNRTWDNLIKDLIAFRIEADLIIADKNGNK